jgi:hypothetical protein
VESGRVKIVSENTSYAYEAAEVLSWLDNPQLITILDANNPKATPLVLERSFADALRENVDQETINRQVN